MPKIIAASHALPPHIAPQSVVRDLVRGIFANQVEDLEKMLSIFDNARIETRQFMMPLHWYLTPHPPAERTRIYQEQGLELMVEAAGRCLEKAACAPAEIDQIIVVSSTGHATPTLDAHLINRLGLYPTTTRLPLWGLGCAGGGSTGAGESFAALSRELSDHGMGFCRTGEETALRQFSDYSVQFPQS